MLQLIWVIWQQDSDVIGCKKSTLERQNLAEVKMGRDLIFFKDFFSIMSLLSGKRYLLKRLGRKIQVFFKATEAKRAAPDGLVWGTTGGVLCCPAVNWITHLSHGA